jgi:hypothetical protein
MRHETISMEVSPLEFEGIKVIDFDLNVDDENKMVIVTMSRYFVGDVRDQCIKKVARNYGGYQVKEVISGY